MLTSSLTFLLNTKLQTYDPVSMALISCIWVVFQNLMHLSAVPPPLASKPCWCGDHEIALTAARWLPNLPTGSYWLWTDQMYSLLSLPPDASYCSSKDHLRPHTSYLWLCKLPKKSSFYLRSLCKMVLSFEPELNTLLLQAMVPTLPSCPLSTLTILPLLMSQTCTTPLLVPIDKC